LRLAARGWRIADRLADRGWRIADGGSRTALAGRRSPPSPLAAVAAAGRRSPLPVAAAARHWPLPVALPVAAGRWRLPLAARRFSTLIARDAKSSASHRDLLRVLPPRRAAGPALRRAAHRP
jgi:hypothetical protein